jgi:hypothetical protein
MEDAVMSIYTDDEKRMMRYDDEIRAFFDGKTIDWGWGKGHVWVCRHENFDTLTVEPPEGGQYEVAVRIKGKDEDGKEIWRGYFCGCLFGHNTNGH